MTTALLTAPELAPYPIDDATRREFLTLLGAAGLLTACGNDTADTRPVASGYPRTIRHDGGETVLEAPPRRVVSLGSKDTTDALLALGVTPVGAGGTADTRGAPLRGLADAIPSVTDKGQRTWRPSRPSPLTSSSATPPPSPTLGTSSARSPRSSCSPTP